MLDVIKVAERAPKSFIEEFPEYPAVVQQLLFSRGILTSSAIQEFLYPDYSKHVHDPYMFKDMGKACERIFKAIEKKQLIAIHGDYDADGVTASALLQTVLTQLGARHTVYLPHREKEGYGLNIKTVNYLAEHGTSLIITCDCGISNIDEVKHANARNIDTIVTDHHQLPASLPPALAIIHPKNTDDKYPFQYLAGGGVAFKVCQALLRHERCKLNDNEKEISEKWLLDLVAIATIADMVPMIGENRVLTKYGLIVLNKTKRLGLQSLLLQSKLTERHLNSETVAFQIVPRINAAGRVDHANVAYELLVAEEPAVAHDLASQLDSHNILRQKKTDQMYRQALSQVQDEDNNVYIFFQDDWPLGLTGLVAGKLSKRFDKAVFVFASDGSQIVGSGRSPKRYNIMKSVTQMAEDLTSFGGHPQACGLRFPFATYDLIHKKIKDYFVLLKPDIEQPVIQADFELDFVDINWELVDLLQSFAPFGVENERPLFVTQNVSVTSMNKVGKNLNHLKLYLTHGSKSLPAIAFSQAANLKSKTNQISILYAIDVNEWNGNKEIQLQIQEIL